MVQVAHPFKVASPEAYLFICLFWAILALITPAFVQADGSQTGSLDGVLRNPSGEAVPGVAVTLDGPQVARNAVTDSQGRFHFPALGPGAYHLRGELLGLVADLRDIQVSVNKVRRVELVLGSSGEADPAASVDAWIRVVAETPLIDRLETRVGANVRFEFLEDLPVERFYQSVALLLPGVTGGEDGNPNASGSLRSSNLYLIDGVDTTDPTTGLFGLNLAYEAIDEVEVTTAAAPIEYGRASGAMINVVTRSGSERMLGLARWVMTNNAWNNDYGFSGDTVEHLDPELAAANAGPNQIDSTLALRLDGPLVADRLFFAGAWESGGASFLRPTFGDGELWDEGRSLESGAFKLSGHLEDSHTVILQHTFDSAELTLFDPFNIRPGETRVPQIPNQQLDNFVGERPADIFALEDRLQDGSFSKVQWYAVWGQNLSMGFNLADQERELERLGRNSRGLTSDAPHLVVLGALPFFDDPDPVFPEITLANGVTTEGFERRPREQASLRIDLLWRARRADHRLAFGVDFQRTESETLLRPAGRQDIDPATGNPVVGQLFFDADLSEECLYFNNCRNAFDGDRGTFLPSQFDNFWLAEPRGTREETVSFYASDTISLDRLVIRAGLRLEKTEGRGAGTALIDSTDLAPRVGLTYDVKGDGKMLLSASWGRFYEPFQQKFLDAFERQDPFTGATHYFWDEFGGCASREARDLHSPCWIPFAATPFLTILPAEIDEGLDRAFVEELVVGFEREIGTSAGLSIHYVDRRWRDLWDDTLTFDGGRPVFTVGQLPGARRSYKAIQVLVERRFADRWDLLASYTRSEAEGNLFQDDGFSTFGDFPEPDSDSLVNRFGPAPFDRPNQLGLFGSYLFPFKRVGVTLSTALRYRDGTPFERINFGRFETPRGSERLPGVFDWDVAANLDVRIRDGLTLEVKAEIFNLTDESQQLGAESFVFRGLQGLPRTLSDLQRPRSFRLTFGVRF